MLILYKGDQDNIMAQDIEELYRLRMNKARSQETRQYWRQKWVEQMHRGFQELNKAL